MIERLRKKWKKGNAGQISSSPLWRIGFVNKPRQNTNCMSNLPIIIVALLLWLLLLMFGLYYEFLKLNKLLFIYKFCFFFTKTTKTKIIIKVVFLAIKGLVCSLKGRTEPGLLMKLLKFGESQLCSVRIFSWNWGSWEDIIKTIPWFLLVFVKISFPNKNAQLSIKNESQLDRQWQLA